MINDNNVQKVNLKDKIVNSLSKFQKRYLDTPIKRKVLKGKILDKTVSLLKYFLLYGLCFVILFPIIQQVAVAIRAPEDINDPSILWIPSKFSIDNITVALIILDYWNVLWNSVWISFCVCALTVISTALAGYTFARINFKGKNILFFLVIILIIVPQTSIELPLKMMLRDMGLLGNPIILFLFAFLCIGIRSGIFIFLFRQFFKNIPEELEEAAYVDGANPFQVFCKIMLPNAKGGIIIVGILSFVWQWNDSYFTTAFVSSTNKAMSTLTTQMLELKNQLPKALQLAGLWDLISGDITANPLFVSMMINTCGILIMLPLIIIYLFLQRKLFTEGVERSGLVG